MSLILYRLDNSAWRLFPLVVFQMKVTQPINSVGLNMDQRLYHPN